MTQKALDASCQAQSKKCAVFFFGVECRKPLRNPRPRVFFGRMQLLNSGNAKTRKGEKLGWITFGIHLAPSNLSGFNVCKDASTGCAIACLNTAGRGAMSSVQKARIAKTRLFFTSKTVFLVMLWDEVAKAIRKADKNKMQPCFRLNLTSDLPWEKIKLNGVSIFDAFPQVQFYDYTKSASRMSSFLAGDMPANYHLTFSRSESNGDVAEAILKSGGNVAMVFRKYLPTHYKGAEVVDGDETDLRFLDGHGKVIGLKEKGLAKKDESGFVLEPQ
jgi:hypothetical protein